MNVSLSAAAGIVLTLAVIVYVGVLAKKKVKSARDFITGSNAGAAMIAGSLIGTLVGGASTIGTAQLAFTYGFSAWWFTLGGGIGLVILALLFAKPIYNSGLTTIPQMLEREYGKTVSTAAAVLMSIGTFMSIVSQLLSGSALMESISALNPILSVAAVVALMMVYVIFGGAFGAGMVGIVKTLLLYLSTLVCGIVSIRLSGGVGALREALPAAQYFNLFARGVWKDGGAGASLIFGVLTTQAYILPVVSGKTLRTSKRGALIGGALTTLIGIAGIFVGMYMRVSMPDISPASALPLFVINCLPDFLAGVILATLLIALVGTGAGLALGISSMLSYDIYKAHINPDISDKALIRMSRCVIAAIFAAAAVLCISEAGSLILGWSFMSMGLRGAVAFAPLCFALFLPGKLGRRYAMAAIVAGPALVFIGSLILPESIDPLFSGMAGALLICAAGRFAGKKRQ